MSPLTLLSAVPSCQVVFKVKPTTKFEKILNAFCNKKAVDVAQVRLLLRVFKSKPTVFKSEPTLVYS